MTKLGTEPLDGALAINARGDVLIGNRVWRHGSSIKLPTLGGKGAAGNAINDRGQIVGWSTTKAGKQHATLWTPR